MEHPLDIVAALSVGGPGFRVDVHADGRRLHCDVPTPGMGWALYRHARRTRTSLPLLVRALEAADVQLRIGLRGRAIAEAGPGIVPSRLAAWIGLPGFRLRMPSPSRLSP